MQLNKIIIFIMSIFCLSSCSKKSLTNKLAIQTKHEITTFKQQVKNSSCKKDEKEIFYKKLNKITENINLITSSCEMEKSLLKEKVTNLKLLLLFILSVLLIMKGKKLCMN